MSWASCSWPTVLGAATSRSRNENAVSAPSAIAASTAAQVEGLVRSVTVPVHPGPYATRVWPIARVALPAGLGCPAGLAPAWATGRPGEQPSRCAKVV